MVVYGRTYGASSLLRRGGTRFRESSRRGGYAEDEHPLQHGTIVAALVRRCVPKASVVIAKVGNASIVASEAVVAGLEWAAYAERADVMNLSCWFPYTETCRRSTGWGLSRCPREGRLWRPYWSSFPERR